MEEINSSTTEKKKPCINCGAELKYKPGTPVIACEYCGHEEQISQGGNEVLEQKLKPYLNKLGESSNTEAIMMLSCKNCGANQHTEEKMKSLHCVYCAAPLVVADGHEEEWILPGGIVPFQLNRNQSHKTFSDWVKGLWFAPGKLKKAALDIDNTKGLYMPYWTFDAHIDVGYNGQRGERYYVDVPHTRVVDGKRVQTTRRETRVNWTSVSGQVQGFVDDTLVRASQGQRHKIPGKVLNWKLDELVPFDTKYLAGFVTEKYTLSLKDGHMESSQAVNARARSLVRRDIGGDEQRIGQLSIRPSKETFKHILLPMYISTYRFKGKKYNFFVNGQTGAISGKRPYSYLKIFFAALAAMLLIILVATFAG